MTPKISTGVLCLPRYSSSFFIFFARSSPDGEKEEQSAIKLWLRHKIPSLPPLTPREPKGLSVGRRKEAPNLSPAHFLLSWGATSAASSQNCKEKEGVGAYPYLLFVSIPLFTCTIWSIVEDGQERENRKTSSPSVRLRPCFLAGFPQATEEEEEGKRKKSRERERKRRRLSFALSLRLILSF